MIAEEVLRYIQLAHRKTYILTHNGTEWLPEYEEELQQLQQIDQELALLRPLVDVEHDRGRERKECLL